MIFQIYLQCITHKPCSNKKEKRNTKKCVTQQTKRATFIRGYGELMGTMTTTIFTMYSTEHAAFMHMCRRCVREIFFFANLCSLFCFVFFILLHCNFLLRFYDGWDILFEKLLSVCIVAMCMVIYEAKGEMNFG